MLKPHLMLNFMSEVYKHPPVTLKRELRGRLLIEDVYNFRSSPEIL